MVDSIFYLLMIAHPSSGKMDDVIVNNVNNFSLQEAKASFLSLIQKFSEESRSKQFFEWIHSTWPSDVNKAKEETKTRLEKCETMLRDIAIDLRGKLPQESILPSEKLFIPVTGENSDCMPECTVHVDAFLYDEDAVDDLVEQGLLARNYCQDCGSRNTQPLVFISHSAPRERLAFIFSALLPSLDGLTLVDVGSRLGPTLYAAYLYSSAAHIVGVEMNEDLCQLQETIIQKYGFQDRVRVVCDDVTNLPDLIHSADVVVLHNVFEFFLPEQQQEAAWRFLRNSVKPGALLVTSPPLSTSLMHLKTGIDLGSWVQEMSPHDPTLTAMLWKEEVMEVTLYRVLSSS